MAIKTFTTGEVLTASDTNTYLANSGLVYVTSATIGSGVSSVTVSGCFSSTYDNYRIVIEGGVGSTSSSTVGLQLGASTAGYYGVMTYALFASGGALVAQDNNFSKFSYVGNAYTNQYATSFDLIDPFLAKFTNLHNAPWIVNNAAGNYSGVHQVATSYSGFTLLPLSGTLTGGTITVYGYRKA
jgi:hypothetical protein